MTVKELDLKLTLGMLRGEKLSPPDEKICGGGHRIESQSDPKSPSFRVWQFLVQLITVPVGHCLEKDQKSDYII